jgi:hypothetical protein
MRQALCPSPGLAALMQAAVRGDLARHLDDGRRRRLRQLAGLGPLLRRWILG